MRNCIVNLNEILTFDPEPIVNKQKIVRIVTVPESFNLLKGQILFMGGGFNLIGVSNNGDIIEEIEQRENIKIKKIELTRTISPIKDLLSLIKLTSFLRKEKPCIVHTHTPKAGTIGMIAAWICRVPIRMHTVAGLPLLETIGIKRTLLNLVEKITYACATKVYPNSSGLKSIIIEQQFCKPEKLKVIGSGSSNGINTVYFNPDLFSESDRFKLRNELQIHENNFVFIFIGRLVGDKGINELVKAFDNISKKHTLTKLLLIGNRETELDPLLEETEQILQNNLSIIQTGYQSDIRPFLIIADVLTFPSYREGFPNVVLQAGAMGLPSIVTNINGCREIIKDGINGLIIPTKDALALENAMLDLMSNQERRNRLAQRSRQLIADRYEQEIVWKLIKQEYEDNQKLAGIV